MATSSSNNKKPEKRRLRPASPTTVREQAAKARENTQNEGRGYRAAFWSGFSWPFRKIGSAVAKLGRFRIFRFLARVLLLSYIANSWRELRQVTWPTRRQSWQLTSAVIIFAVIFGALVAGVDYGLDKLFKEIVLK